MYGSNDYNEYGYISTRESNSFIRKAFLHSIGGVICSAIVAIYLLFFNRSLFYSLGQAFYIVPIVQVGIALVMGIFLSKLSAVSATVLYYAYAAFTGVTFAMIGVIYTGSSILIALTVTLTLFILLSVYGYTTKEDLSKYGGFLKMGLLAIIILSIANLLLKTSFLYWGITVAAVVIFTGLIAYDVNRIKRLSTELVNTDPDVRDKLGIMMAFHLYLDFVNLFIYILRIVGKRR